jgi:hypothetical protein
MLSLQRRASGRPGLLPGKASVQARGARARHAPAVGDPDGMTDLSATQATDGVPTYLGNGDPAGRFADYCPAWVDKLAGDVTLEGSMLDGALQGPGRHPSRHRRRPRAVRPPGLQLRRPLGPQQLHRGLHRRSSRQSTRVPAPGRLQHRRPDAAHRSPLPAAELADVLLPPAAREVRRHSVRRALSRRRGLTRHHRDLVSHRTHARGRTTPCSAAHDPCEDQGSCGCDCQRDGPRLAAAIREVKR